MTRKSFFKTCVGMLLTASLSLVLLGCLQKKNLSIPSVKNNGKLNVTALLIHNVPVENGKVTVYKKTVTSADVKAICSYGSVTDEPITVTVKNEPFQCNTDGTPKTLELSIPAKEGSYTAWSTKVDVTYENIIPKPELKTLTVHGFAVSDGKVSVNKDSIEAKDIEAVFNYGSQIGKQLPVIVAGGTVTVNKTGVTKLSLSVAEKEDEYQGWKQDIEVSYNADLKSPLKLSSLKIHGFTVKNLQVTLNTETVEASNIEAEFTYTKDGTPKTETIPVTVEGGSFTVDKNAPKALKLSVAKGTDYEAWYGEITVTYDADITPDGYKLKLVSMKIHHNPVVIAEENSVTIAAETVESKNITAILSDGSTEKEYAVTVEGGTFQVDMDDTQPVNLSVPKQAGVHGGWEGSVEVTYEKPAALSIYCGTYKGEDVEADKEIIGKIFSGEEVLIPVKAPVATLYIIGSMKGGLKSVTLNGVDSEIEEVMMLKTAVKKCELPAIGSITSYTLEIVSEQGTIQLLKFKLKREEGVLDIPGIQLFFNNETEEFAKIKRLYAGKTVTYKTDTPKNTLRFVFESDVVKTLTVDDSPVPVKMINNVEGAYYEAVKILDDVSPKKNISIIIEPKDSNIYYEHTWNILFMLANDEKDNIEFVENSNGVPDVTIETLQFYDGKEHNESEDYGAERIKIKAKTVNPNSKVFYTLLGKDSVFNYLGEGIEEPFTEEDRKGRVELTYDSGSGYHIAELTTKENLPTNVYLWVQSENGNDALFDEPKGNVYLRRINKIDLLWDYADHSEKEIFKEVEVFKNYAYDEILIDSAKVVDNKIYLLFSGWSDERYTLDETYTCTGQTNIHLGDDDTPLLYKVIVDVSALLDKSKTELEAAFPIAEIDEEDNEKKTLCFVYKVKVKLIP